MKRIFIVTINKKVLVYLTLCLLIGTVIILSSTSIVHLRHSQVFNNSTADDILEIEKENSKLQNLVSSLLPSEQKTIYEDGHRNIFMNAGITPPPSFPASPLSKVIANGVDTKFKILNNDPEYLRPTYDPEWKGFYFRGWLYLPHKNIEAHHRIFAFSLGASANFDIFGSLGYSLKSISSAPIDNHHNINFLIYGFEVKNVRVFQNQVALIGEPKFAGAQVVSIVQNELLPQGVDTKDFLFQLSTPQGYEVDFLNLNIIRYEYLMKQIEEHSVHPSFADETQNKSLEKLLKENAALKKELTFFIPLQDKLISQQVCQGSSNNVVESFNIVAIIQQGKKISYDFNYKNAQYMRPLYSPSWKENYKRKWAYIPEQIESNMHRLHLIPQSQAAQYDFFGSLAFHEKYRPIQSGYHGLLVYNFNISQVILYKNQLLLIGVPSRTGAEIVSINPLYMKGYESYFARLITPDNYQLDCINLTP
jgi:hypothetical protein